MLPQPSALQVVLPPVEEVGPAVVALHVHAALAITEQDGVATPTVAGVFEPNANAAVAGGGNRLSDSSTTAVAELGNTGIALAASSGEPEHDGSSHRVYVPDNLSGHKRRGDVGPFGRSVVEDDLRDHSCSRWSAAPHDGTGAADFTFQSTDFWAQGLNLGLQFRY